MSFFYLRIVMFLMQIKSCEDVSVLKELITTNGDILYASGFTKPTTTVKLDDKAQIIATVALHSVILQSLAEISQFHDGLLKIEGMEEILVTHSNLLESFYCKKDVVPLTSGKVCKICV